MIRAALLLGLLAWSPRDPEHNGSPNAVDTALMWISAIRDNHSWVLGSFMTFPFSYREAWASKRCARVIENADALGPWLACTHEKEAPFIRLLRSASDDPGRFRMALGLSAASPRLRSMASSAGKRSSFVSGSISGDGVTYSFVFVVSGTDQTGRRTSAMFIDSPSAR